MSLFDRLRATSSDPTATAIPANPATGLLAVAESSSFSSSSLPANDDDNVDGYYYDPVEAARFWEGLTDRINWCDILIHELCEIRGDSQARRDDLLLTRQRTSPANVDSDIRSLLEEIERVAPTSTPEPIRDCRDCNHHRGRNNNAIRYCVATDSAAQRDNALASVIVDCSIATHCKAFRRHAK